MAPTKRVLAEKIEDLDFKKPDHAERAEELVKDVPNVHLHLSASLVDRHLAHERWLARMELDRRRDELVLRHEKRMARMSAGGALVGALLGALLTWFLSSF